MELDELGDEDTERQLEKKMDELNGLKKELEDLEEMEITDVEFDSNDNEYERTDERIRKAEYEEDDAYVREHEHKEVLKGMSEEARNAYFNEL